MCVIHAPVLNRGNAVVSCSLRKLASLHRILSRSARPGVTLPGISAVFKAETVAEQLDELVQSSQMWAIHNLMDDGAADSQVRQCGLVVAPLG